MTTATRDEIRDHLFQKLTETAESIRQGGAMTDHQITVAFLAVGVTLAQHIGGPVAAAEWLRDMADEVERGEALCGGLQ
ncbi:hypothetical protein K1T73_10375 [Roseovarius sp. SCSIO 43702]|uniref:hypothetical protein n=1 Tax=Roseovarius sp. SCSIO 43702 TaxID=2823043 RepID=UPI001C72A0FF|nr:hypothetical protein [Roseovarius sp. SCSIO 43702]QYX55507.1 hypothetical protein K1T73_10375 [Roseovarius sp. SCSIO 43702]